jgi:YfiR/HmsC-like
VTIRHGSPFALGILLCLGGLVQGSDDYRIEEYRVKAAFLFNFAKFVEWPAQAFKSPSDPIVIGVVGKNPFGNALTEVLAGKTWGGRAFQVREVVDAQQAASCQIVFVSASERKRLGPLLSRIGNSGVLTVGEMDNFASEGGIINFKIDSGSVHLQINVEAARKQQLHISAKLLSLAEIVGK